MSKPVSPFKKSFINPPKKDAPAPSPIKTSETPKRKMRERLNNVRLILAFCSPCNSFTLTPVIYDIYAGKIGSTHGDRNESAPAPIANNIPTTSIVSPSIPPIMNHLSFCIFCLRNSTENYYMYCFLIKHFYKYKPIYTYVTNEYIRFVIFLTLICLENS